MNRQRLIPMLAIAVVVVIAFAGVVAVLAQTIRGDDDEASDHDGTLVKLERDGDILRLELDLRALGLDPEALGEGKLSLEDLSLPALRALLAAIGVAPEDLDFESGGLEALRPFLGGGNGDAGELLRRFLEDRDAPRLQPNRPDQGQPRPAPDGFRFPTDRPLLGVSLDDALVVTAVLPGSAAADAGVEVGDALQTVDGVAVGSIEDLRAAIANVAPGARYELGVTRDGAAVALEVERPRALTLQDDVLPQLDGAQLRDLLGGLRSGRLSLEDLPPNLRQFFSDEPRPQPLRPQTQPQRS